MFFSNSISLFKYIFKPILEVVQNIVTFDSNTVTFGGVNVEFDTEEV